jgi:hypothetical protein
MRYTEHIQTKQNSLAENHMSKVTHLKAALATTVAKHIHLTTDIEPTIRYALENNYAEHDESEQLLIVGVYGFVHLSNNPDSDFKSLMNNHEKDFSWSSLNANVMFDLNTHKLDIALFLEDYWLCGDAEDCDPSDVAFIELNPSRYESELVSHCLSELDNQEFLELFTNSALKIKTKLQSNNRQLV